MLAARVMLQLSSAHDALVQYVAGQKYLKGAGEMTEESRAKTAGAKKILIGSLIGASLVAVAIYMMRSQFTLTQFAQWTGIILLVMVILYFGFMIALACRNDQLDILASAAFA